MIMPIDLICIQECINLYKGEHGKIKDVLEHRKVIEVKHTEFSIGFYNGRIIVTVRGSDGTADWIENFKFWKTTNKIKTFNARVHEGFCEGYEDIKEPMREELRVLDNFIFNGHSRGGGIVQRAALDYIGLKFFDITTFGSPRAVDYRTANFINSNVAISKRFTYKNDIVTHLPTAFMNFCHLKGHITLGKESFWDKVNPIDDADDHRPEHYENEIAKALLK